MDFNKAMAILKKTVGESHLEGMPYLNFMRVPADQRAVCEQAMAVVQSAVARGELTQEELKKKLGLAD